MGKQQLCLYPDLRLDPEAQSSPGDFVLVDPQRYFAGIGHALRLSPGETLAIDRNTHDQIYAFSSPREAFRRHFSIVHAGDALVFKDPISELGTYISLREGDGLRILNRRIAALRRIRDIFGDMLQPFPADEALEVLKKVNRCLRQAAYRPKDTFGNPGGLLQLPPRLVPILVGDLHAQIDNLLKILSENSFLESLEKGEAALIIIGDAVHAEEEGKLEAMDSSLLMMDLIFKLKLQYPEQVFYLVGNHDSFSHDLMKHGVPQGLLWEKHVVATRGDEYKAELDLFYRQSPLVLVSDDFIACHAGPPRSKVSMETLVNVRQFPDVVRNLTWSRIRTSGFPAGYTRADVRRFRKGLEVESATPFIVGHHPYSAEGTLWQNVGHIAQHHIVLSCRPDQIGLFTRIDGHMVAQRYPTEPLAEWLNQLPAAT